MQRVEGTPRGGRRVAVIVHRLVEWGGAEGSTVLFLERLARSEFEVLVIVLTGEADFGVRAELEATGMRFVEVGGGLRRWLSVTRRELTAFGPDLVHTTMFDPDLVGRLVAPLVGAPVLVSLVNMQYSPEAVAVAPSPRKLEIVRQVERVLSRRGTAGFHALTSAVGRHATDRLGADPGRIAVVPRGRKLDVYDVPAARAAAVRDELGIAPDAPIVLSVARQERQKGLELLLDAFAAVLVARPETVLLVAGREGSATEELHEHHARLGLGDRARFLGARTDVPDLLAAADGFVSTARYEGFGGAVLEAMAAATPIVAFDIEPVREVLGGTGTLVALGDVTALASAIGGVLADRELAAEVGRAERAEARARFSAESAGDRLTDLYRQVIDDVDRFPRPVLTRWGARLTRKGPIAPKASRGAETPLADTSVLYLIPGLGPGGGAERSLLDVAPGLAEVGISLAVACFYDRSETASAALGAAGVEVIHLPETGFLRRVVAVRRLLRARRPDIFHTTLYEADVVGRVAAIGTGVTVMTSLVNTSYEPARLEDRSLSRWRVEVVRHIEGFTLRHLNDHVHANSAAVRDSAVRTLGADPARISVVHRGRDTMRLGDPTAERRTAARAGLGLTDDQAVIVSIGRIEFQKGQVHLVDAMPEVLRRHPEAVVLVAGRSGSASPDVERAIERNGVADHVRLLGHRDDVIELLVAADVLAFPSRWEGLPGTIIEAMALNVPIVASSIPPVTELVDDCSAVLVEPGDAESLAKGLVAVLDDPAGAAIRAERGRRRFDAEFRAEHARAKMRDLYLQLGGRSTVP